MEIKKVREVLQEVTLDHNDMPTDEAIKRVAVALLHIAESVHKLERNSTEALMKSSRKSGYS